MPPANARRDSLPVAIGLGVVAYIATNMLHEAAGHGIACVATGGRVALLYPLGMRCTVATPVMVAAGPAMNLLAGALCWYLVAKTNALRSNARYFVWLGMVFNLLGAAGYLGVGGLLNFGDWASLIGGHEPAAVWRTAAVLVAAGSYYAFLRTSAAEYYRFTGPSGLESPRLYRLALLPAVAACVVACAAATLSPWSKTLALELSVASTLGPGLSLLAVPDLVRSMRFKPIPEPDEVTWSVPWLVVALVAGAAFVAVIGPGIRFR